MIEIKVTTSEKAKEKCECGAHAVLCETDVDLQIAGEYEEVKYELIALIESIEKKPTLAVIWREALIEHTADMEKSAK